jgi:hypothetical protein
MIGWQLVSWFGRPFYRTQEAKRALVESQSEVPRVRRLASDLRAIESENHITDRVHRAMRGGSDRG